MADKQKPKGKAGQWEIEHNIVLSTGHITLKDRDLLHEDAGPWESRPKPGLIVYEYEEGFFLHCSPDQGFFEDELRVAQHRGYSADLIALMRLAKAQNCKFVHLDADGPVHPNLPQHDW